MPRGPEPKLKAFPEAGKAPGGHGSWCGLSTHSLGMLGAHGLSGQQARVDSLAQSQAGLTEVSCHSALEFYGVTLCSGTPS